VFGKKIFFSIVDRNIAFLAEVKGIRQGPKKELGNDKAKTGVGQRAQQVGPVWGRKKEGEQ
jgi:hypothetical protein